MKSFILNFFIGLIPICTLTILSYLFYTFASFIIPVVCVLGGIIICVGFGHLTRDTWMLYRPFKIGQCFTWNGNMTGFPDTVFIVTRIEGKHYDAKRVVYAKQLNPIDERKNYQDWFYKKDIRRVKNPNLPKNAATTILQNIN